MKCVRHPDARSVCVDLTRVARAIYISSIISLRSGI